MKQKERTHFISPFREEERKSERRLSFFILFLPQTEWRISPFPGKRKEKKGKDEKMEERRQKEEGQKRRWAERREKDKEEGERGTGKGWEKRQQNMSQKGAFLTQESRKGAGRGILPGSRKRGWERHFLPYAGDDGRTVHLPVFSFPIRISKHGKSGEPYFAFFLPFSAMARTPPPLPFPFLLSVYLSFHLRFTKMCEKPTPLGVGWIACFLFCGTACLLSVLFNWGRHHLQLHQRFTQIIWNVIILM